MNENVSPQTVGTEGQYSLAQILGIWVAAALPMALLGWVAHPALAAKSIVSRNIRKIEGRS